MFGFCCYEKYLILINFLHTNLLCNIVLEPKKNGTANKVNNCRKYLSLLSGKKLSQDKETTVLM